VERGEEKIRQLETRLQQVQQEHKVAVSAATANAQSSSEAANLKSALESTHKENQVLKTRVMALEAQAPTEKSGPPTSAERELEFQRSVIADLQTKNKKLEGEAKEAKEKYEKALEAGFGAVQGKAAADGKTKPPDRAYCDICEQFGHSASDCTATNEAWERQQQASVKKQKPGDRPFCEICEQFGHRSEECPTADAAF